MSLRLESYLLTIMAVFWAPFAQPQTPVVIEWQQSYYDWGGVDGGEIRQTPDGGYIVGGSKNRSGFGLYDYWGLRLDSQGNIAWQVVFGGTRMDLLRKVFVMPDGGFVFVGDTDSFTDGNKTSPSLGCGDIWLVRVDATGTKMWDRTVGSSLCDLNACGCPTSDGGLLLGAQVQYGSRRIDYFVWRVDAIGDVLWFRSFGGATNDRIWSVQQTTDGGFVLGGDSTSAASGEKTAPRLGGYDYWLVRLDASGGKLWDRTYGGTSNDVLQAVIETSDGGFLLGGSSASGVSGNKTAPALGGSDLWFVRVDASGNKLWDVAYGGSGDEAVSGLELMSDGGFMAIGVSNSTPGENKNAPSFGDHDIWLVRLDSVGKKLWDFSLGGNSRDLARAVQPTADGGFIVGGGSLSGETGNKATPASAMGDIWVVKLSSERPRLEWERCCFEDTGPQWRLMLTGVSNLTYRTEISSNLVDWTPLQTNKVNGTPAEVLRGSVESRSDRFFRALLVR